MIFQPTPLSGSYLVIPEPVADNRGWFARTFSKDIFQQIGHEKEWVQMNISVTNVAGTIRGMHFQVPPYREIKMVQCIKGRVFDVIIDVRKDSPTFLQWMGTILSGENHHLLYIPEGFAHGFQTMTDNCELIYHHSEYYKSGFEGGIRYNDPLVKIDWPVDVTEISARDSQHPLLTDQFKGI